MHVLIIEDETFLALHMQSLFEEVGAHSIDIAASESEAVTCAKKHRPDLLTSDFQLIEGTGPSALCNIRAELGAIKAIYVTSNPHLVHVHGPDSRVLVKARQVAGSCGGYEPVWAAACHYPVPSFVVRSTNE